MEPVRVAEGDSPLILAFPHVGTFVPSAIAARLNDEGRLLRDTDWHIHDLYAGLAPDATTVTATHSRYVIDLNRDPSGQSLYPGQATTGLIPETTFDNAPIWADGAGPTPADVTERLAQIHTPYHAALDAQVARVKARHGVAVVYDCHSIRSRCPWLFDGDLPDLNIGTNGGQTCAPELEAAVVGIAGKSPYSSILNGRFKGGWTTRHYGQPQNGIHAIQMELAQITHLAAEAPPFAMDETKAAALRQTLRAILSTLAELALTLPRT